MRVFVAVPIDSETRHRLAHLVSQRVPVVPGRPVAPENWHLTLRFLGEIDDVAVDRLVAALDAADLGTSFRVRWGDLGAFPSAARAGVLWIGVDSEGATALDDLSVRVDDALEAAGRPPEDRPFRPHLTISRMRPQVDARGLLGGGPLGVAMPVDRVAVFQSRLGRGGAQYRVIEEFPLAT